VQDKINDLLWFGETLVAEDGMRHREGNCAQGAGRLDRIQPELILVGFDQRGDRTVENLIVGLMLCPKAVVIMCLLTQPERSEQRENSAQPLLENSDCRNQPLLEAQGQIDVGKLVACALDVKRVLDYCIDQRLFGRKGSEDGSLRDTRSLGNLPGTHLAAEPLKQWLRGCNERGSALIERQRSGPGHQASIVSERSLNKAQSQKFRLSCNSGTIGGPSTVGHTELAGP
jgi:hypothetical protein